MRKEILPIPKSYALFLRLWVREQKIAIWSEADLQLGETKAEATKKQLMQAEIIILLVSSHFFGGRQDLGR